MNKIVKRMLLAVAGILIPLAGAGLFFSCAMLSMKPVETGEIPNSGIYAVRNAKNGVYFIKTDNGYIMIDAGSNAGKLMASLEEAGIDAGDVGWIFLTHSDYDHVAALPLFPNAVIYMGEDELPMINGTMKRNALGRNSMPDGIDIDNIVLLHNSRELPLNGTTVRCIAAPGHTPGSVLYLVDGKYLFTGDAFKVSKGVMGVHPFTMDKKLAAKTLEQLKEIISGSVVLTAHYGCFEGLQ